MMSDRLPPSEQAQAQTPRSFRWRLLPASILGAIGLFHVVSSSGWAFFAIFYNIQHGWVVVDPVDPRTSPWALCHFNLSLWQIHFWFGVTGITSAWAWLRGRWFIASGTMLLMPLLVLLLRIVFTWYDAPKIG